MSSAEHVWRGALLGAVDRHQIAAKDPLMAERLKVALSHHVTPGVQASYDSTTRKYIAFCEAHDLEPWPLDEILLSAWILDLTSSIQTQSLKTYISGVKSTQLALDPQWDLGKGEFLRRTMNYIKRKFPIQRKQGEKFSLSLHHAILMFYKIPGWPLATSMSHNDRTFIAATLCGILGFLRGGEFLTAKHNSRELLKTSSARFQNINEVNQILLDIPQPKEKWWLARVIVPIFANEKKSFLCPIRRLREYQSLSPYLSSLSVSQREVAPLFHLSCGTPLSRNVMIMRSKELLNLAGITCIDRNNLPAPLRMASWRAGGVRTAIDAKIDPCIIMELGRWSSSAWLYYLIHTASDLRGAGVRMWSSAIASTAMISHLRVGGTEMLSGPLMSLSVDEVEAVRMQRDMRSAPKGGS
jgi:hypothetical protein